VTSGYHPRCKTIPFVDRRGFSKLRPSAVLISIQFPLADSRPFLNIDSGLLKRPTWPRPAATEFVRHFGSIRGRKLGGVKGWVGENDICEAVQALKFVEFLPKMYRCAFRRFFFDGHALGKYELGVSTKRRVWFEGDDALKAVNNFLSTRVAIRRSTTSEGFQLAESGRHIADLYLAATTSSKCNTKPQKWWVEAGTPLLVLEYREDEWIELPHWLKITSLEVPPEFGVSLSHCFIDYKGNRIPMWILGREHQQSKSYWDSYRRDWYLSRFNKARTLRLYLLRLHAEHYCLQTILRNIATEKIVVSEALNETNRLQLYLSKSIKKISNLESKFTEDDVAALARTFEDKISPGQRDALLALFERENLRFTVRRKVQDYTQVINLPGGVLNMAEKIDSGDHITVSGGQVGAVGRNAHVHDVNFNQVWQQVGNEIDLSALADDLSKLLPELRKRASAVEQDEAVLAVGKAADSAKNGNGPQVLQYLKTAGKWVLDVAKDVGAKVTVEVIKKSIYPGA